MIRIFLADSQRLLNEGIKAIIDRTDDMQVTGVAENSEDTVEFLKEDMADVVLLSVLLEEMDGIKTMKILKEMDPGVKVVMMTEQVLVEQIVAALHAGADGLLVKQIYAEKLVDSIRNVVEGEAVFSGTAARILAKTILELTIDKRELFISSLDKVPFRLSRREKEVVYLLSQNYTNSEIASKLYLSEGTVKNYVSGIYTKFNIRNRALLIKHLRELS